MVVSTIVPLLASLLGSPKPLRCGLDRFGSFFFEFCHVFGLIFVFPDLEFRELTILLLKIFMIATTAVTFPVLEFSVAFS